MNKIIKWLKTWFNRVERKETTMSAVEAYFRTKYGVYRSVEQRIKDNQRNINEQIKSKITPSYRADTKFSSFYCVIDLDEELKPHIKEIFKPFIENGFKVINLSEKVEEINDELVFLVSWYQDNFDGKK